MQNVPVTHKCHWQPTPTTTTTMTTKQSQNLRILMHHKLLKNLPCPPWEGAGGAAQLELRLPCGMISAASDQPAHHEPTSCAAPPSCAAPASVSASSAAHLPLLLYPSLFTHPTSAHPSSILSSLKACAPVVSLPREQLVPPCPALPCPRLFNCSFPFLRTPP